MKSWYRKLFRITGWISSYDRSHISGDLKAGLTTGIMLIPQGMAYAVIAGVPPIYGLYAGVVPLLIYPIFGTSRHLSIGPVAVDMLIVAAGISVVSVSGNFDLVGLVILITMMTGIIQLLMGAFRLGSLLNIFSRPVITGFIMAAPIIIAFTQIENLFGVQLNGSQNVIILLKDFSNVISEIHNPTMYWGLSAIIFLIALNRLTPKLPVSMILLCLSITVAWFIDIENMDVEITGNIPEGLPPFSFPLLNYEIFQELLPTAITLALVQFMTITSLGKVFAKRHGYLIDSNQELTSVGASNFIGSFFSSLPVSGSFSRSAAAEQANAKTPLTNIFTALVIITTLLFLTPVFYYLPMPVLAGIIIVSVFGLIDLKEIEFLLKTKKSEGGIAIFTFLSTILIGIQEGILLGVGASMLLMLYKASRPSVAELGVLPNTRSFKNIERNPDAKRIEGILILRIDASFSFINAEFFRDFILEKSEEQDKKTRYVIIDGSSINLLDTTAIDALISIIKTLRNWNMDLYLAGLKGPVRDIIEKSGFEKHLGSDHFCRTPHMAVKKILEMMDREDNGGRSEKYQDISL
ncbi:MAG: SulP family inorganic anion transporter [Balneolaceae bacterium]